MKNSRKSLRNLVSAGIGQILILTIGFMLPKLVISHFGSQVNGLINSVNQMIVYLSLFEAGVGAVALQALYGPVFNRDWDSINGVLSATNHNYRRTGIAYLISLICLSFVYPALIFIDLPYFYVSIVIFFCGFPSVISFLVQAKYVILLRADGRNYIITNLATLVVILSGGLRAIVILLGFDIIWAIVISSLVNLIQPIYIVGYVKKHFPSLEVAGKANFSAISQKNYVLVHQISTLVFQNTDMIILALANGLKYVSVYSIYRLITTQLSQIIQIPLNSIEFFLGQTYQENKNDYLKRIDTFESYFGAFLFSVYAVVYYALFDFVRLYTSGVTDIVYADKILVLLFVIIELLSLSRMPMLQTINFAGHFKSTTPQSIIESAINISVSLIALKIFGIYGVLIGTIVALLYRTNEIIVYANTKLLGRYPWHTYSIYVINIICFIVAQYIFGLVLPPIDTSLTLVVNSVLATMISTSVYFIVQTCIWKDNRAIIKWLFKAIAKRIYGHI